MAQWRSTGLRRVLWYLRGVSVGSKGFLGSSRGLRGSQGRAWESMEVLKGPAGYQGHSEGSQRNFGEYQGRFRKPQGVSVEFQGVSVTAGGALGVSGTFQGIPGGFREPQGVSGTL